ncbi:MAG: methylated-DNA--[protein]-cysteine S-methyltransferase [Ruminiclostridium sp.]|nr:methylated-DNA--[protein]-cysteine S-methyltransferase [Ruminiclostridium sp.]
MEQAFYKTKFGDIKIEYEGNMLFSLKTVGEFSGEGHRTKFTNKVFTELVEYFSGTRKSFDIPYKLTGMEFQLKVWRELEKIPYGTTRTYKEIAEGIGRHKAVRAVGSACGKNPIWIIVPCHRVVGSDGRLTGYAGGVDMKRELLEIEKSEFVKK